ncbi:daunorubicin resistance protein DrrA family ABC transporter ATP-binding protein [Intrasporangium mesophilum]
MTQHPVAAAKVATPSSPPPGETWAIEAVGLVKTYSAGRRKPPVRALDGLTLRVRSGEVFGLLGPNGAGKSTTVRILSTLSRPDSGAARVAGHDVLADPSAVRHAIGLVSQKPSAAPLMTGRESLEMAARIQGMSHTDARHRSDELLERFGLAEAADRLTKTYSGGMNRKLDVAIGLVNRPAVLFLDEPTTGLDPEARAEMWAEIARMASVDRMTVLLTTHYLDEADHLSDRLAIVDHGRLVAHGSPDELKSELRGDSLVFELADPASGSVAAQRLSQLDSLVDIVHEGRTVRARADRGASVIPTALAVLEQGGIDVSSATLARPSLDDVYLRHAGRAFEEVAS